jgi:nitroreductase
MLILLAAQSQGLGSCYMTGPLMAQPDLADVLQLPKDRQIGALIPVGKPMP